jgi:hypothetical protein
LTAPRRLSTDPESPGKLPGNRTESLKSPSKSLEPPTVLLRHPTKSRKPPTSPLRGQTDSVQIPARMVRHPTFSVRFPTILLGFPGNSVRFLTRQVAIAKQLTCLEAPPTIRHPRPPLRRRHSHGKKLRRLALVPSRNRKASARAATLPGTAVPARRAKAPPFGCLAPLSCRS